MTGLPPSRIIFFPTSSDHQFDVFSPLLFQFILILIQDGARSQEAHEAAVRPQDVDARQAGRRLHLAALVRAPQAPRVNAHLALPQEQAQLRPDQ